MKKVLIINHAFVLDINRRVYKVLAELGDLDITLLSPGKWVLKDIGKVEKFEGINLSGEGYRVLKRFGILCHHPALYHFPYQLFFLMLKNKYDTVIVQEDIYSLISFQVVFLSKIFKFKVIIDSWQNILKKYPFPFNCFQKYVVNNATRINAGGREIEKILRKKGVEGEIMLTPLAYDERLFFSGCCPDNLKAELNLEGIVIGYFGRLIKEKGVQYLLQAVRDLDFVFTLIIDDIGGDFTEDIHRLVKEYNLEDKTRFISPKHAAMPPYYRCLDILVLPTYTTGNIKEQFGRVITEAMASGVNVIGSDCGEIPHLIGDAGLVFKEKNVPMLRDCIVKLVNNPDLRVQLKEKGLKRADELFSTRAVAKIYNEQIQSLKS